MTTEELLNLHDETCKTCREIMQKKNSDYTGGKGATDPFANFNASKMLDIHPVQGLLLRVIDKIKRIYSFTNDSELSVPNETVEDACDDIVNYAILAKAMLIEERNLIHQDQQIKKLMVVAHPDDELIFGGAELIKYGPEYKVICLTNKYHEIRSKEFERVMKKLKVGSWEMFDYKDDIYSTDGSYNINSILLNRNWEKIVTHNPAGEYGHPQHKSVFDYINNIICDDDILYVFGKSNIKLDKDILETKKEMLSLYESERHFMDQILTQGHHHPSLKQTNWFKSSDNNVNYIEHESIEKYEEKKNKNNYVACYKK